MSSNSEIQTKVPPNLALTALLSSGITIVSSISYIILSLIAIVYRYNCNVATPETTDNAQYTWHLIFQVYIQDAKCEHAMELPNVTKSHSVFVLVLLTLIFSSFTLIASIFLTAAVKSQELLKYMNAIVIAYIVLWVGSMVVDVTLATHLGMDYGYLTTQLRDSPTYNYALDSLRHGAFVLMSVSLKGYVTLVINLVLIGLLIIYTYDYHNASTKEQHSIHKVGALSAFDQRRTVGEWAQSDYTAPFSRERTNNAFINDDDQPRSLPRSDYYPTSNQSFNRSDSWQHQPQNGHGSRPFSYMEEVRRPAPARPPASPASPASEPWRRDAWPPAPLVPAPDYSPHSPRRLKSALKPAGYI